jgi:hypothetical protein
MIHSGLRDRRGLSSLNLLATLPTKVDTAESLLDDKMFEAALTLTSMIITPNDDNNLTTHEARAEFHRSRRAKEEHGKGASDPRYFWKEE